MTTLTSRAGPVTFEHSDDYRGDVKITRGDVTVIVTVDSIRNIVAESVRHELSVHISKMKPADLLRRIA